MKIGALVLAAGKGSRFGSPKQLLEIDGESLLDRACRTALATGCDPVLRVLGAHAEAILKRPSPAGVGTLVHGHWEEGMGSSLAAGAAHLLEQQPDLDALFILLSDQPAVTSQLLDSMAAELDEVPVVWCGHSGVTGPPALFSRECFPGLRALRGDRGAKSVAMGHPSAIVGFPGARWDIDSPEAWEKFQQRSPSD